MDDLAQRRRGKNLAAAAAWLAEGCPGWDSAEWIAELEAGNADPAYIAHQRAEAESLLRPRRIWPEGWDIARVYEMCAWQKVGVMHVLLPTAIPCTEVLAACQLLKIPQERWDHVLYGVRMMAAVALPILQRKAIG